MGGRGGRVSDLENVMAVAITKYSLRHPLSRDILLSICDMFHQLVG